MTYKELQKHCAMMMQEGYGNEQVEAMYEPASDRDFQYFRVQWNEDESTLELFAED